MEVKLTQPLLPLRDIVVFPSMVIPLFVGRDKSITALNEVMKKDKKIVLVTQKNSEVDDPKKNDIFSYGCESSILQLLKLPDGTVKVLVEGIKRVKITKFIDDQKFISCSYEGVTEIINKEEDLMPLAMTAIKKLEKLTSVNKKISNETISNIKQLKDPSQIADNIEVDILNFKKILKLIKYYKIKLVIVGPEEPLVKGLVNFLQKNKIKSVSLEVSSHALDQNRLGNLEFLPPPLLCSISITRGG